MTTRHRLGAALTVLALLFTFIATALMPTMAQAKTVSRFYASQAGVMSACKAAGGAQTNGIGPGGYGCVKSNCGGKGTHCAVECTAAGDCTGGSGTIDRRGSKGLSGFLGGLLKRRDYQPPQSIVDGVDTNAGAAAAPSAPASAPAPTPPIFN